MVVFSGTITNLIQNGCCFYFSTSTFEESSLLGTALGFVQQNKWKGSTDMLRRLYFGRKYHVHHVRVFIWLKSVSLLQCQNHVPG